MNPRPLLALASAIGVLVCSDSATFGGSDPTSAAPQIGIAAVVNGQPISVNDVRKLAIEWEGMTILEKYLIPNLLVDQEAKRDHVSVTPAEIDGRVADARLRLKVQGHQTLESALAASNRTYAEFRDGIRLRLEAEKIVRQTTPAPRYVHLRQIFVSTQPSLQNSRTRAHTAPEALAIINKAYSLLTAGETFENVAKKYSEDPTTKDSGGDLHIVGPTTPLDPNIMEAAMSLSRGAYTKTPVRTVLGYYILRVDSTNTDAPTTERAAYAKAIQVTESDESLRQQQVESQEITDLIQRLTLKAKIVNYLKP